MVKSNEITVKRFIETCDFNKFQYHSFKVCKNSAVLVEVSWSDPLSVTKTDAYMAVLMNDETMLGNRVLSATYNYADKELILEI